MTIRLLLAVVLTCSFASLPGVAGAQGADAQWTTPAGTPQGTRDTALTAAEQTVAAQVR